MRCVAVALPLSIVGVLILSSVAWACGDLTGRVRCAAATSVVLRDLAAFRIAGQTGKR